MRFTSNFLTFQKRWLAKSCALISCKAIANFPSFIWKNTRARPKQKANIPTTCFWQMRKDWFLRKSKLKVTRSSSIKFPASYPVQKIQSIISTNVGCFTTFHTRIALVLIFSEQSKTCKCFIPDTKQRYALCKWKINTWGEEYLSDHPRINQSEATALTQESNLCKRLFLELYLVAKFLCPNHYELSEQVVFFTFTHEQNSWFNFFQNIC